jgi:hypothetical protein
MIEQKNGRAKNRHRKQEMEKQKKMAGQKKTIEKMTR